MYDVKHKYKILLMIHHPCHCLRILNDMHEMTVQRRRSRTMAAALVIMNLRQKRIEVYMEKSKQVQVYFAMGSLTQKKKNCLF